MKSNKLKLCRGRIASVEVKCKLIADFHRSGERASDFCRRRGISQSSFYRWKKKLGKPDRSELPAFVQVVPVIQRTADIAIDLVDGTQIRCRTETEALGSLLKTLMSGGVKKC